MPHSPSTHIERPQIPKWVIFKPLSPGGNGTKLTFSSVFVHGYKDPTVPSLSVHRITIPMLYWMYYGLLNKGQDIQIPDNTNTYYRVYLKNTEKKLKKRKKTKGRAFSRPVSSWLFNRWMNSVEGVLCCMGPSFTMPAYQIWSGSRQSSKVYCIVSLYFNIV